MSVFIALIMLPLNVWHHLDLPFINRWIGAFVQSFMFNYSKLSRAYFSFGVQLFKHTEPSHDLYVKLRILTAHFWLPAKVFSRQSYFFLWAAVHSISSDMRWWFIFTHRTNEIHVKRLIKTLIFKMTRGQYFSSYNWPKWFSLKAGGNYFLCNVVLISLSPKIARPFFLLA